MGSIEGYTVDIENHAISAPITHFSMFTILAYIRPATFKISNLTINPSEVEAGKTVAIIFLITNTGDLAGSYEATLKINGIIAETKQVDVAGGAQ